MPASSNPLAALLRGAGLSSASDPALQEGLLREADEVLRLICSSPTDGVIEVLRARKLAREAKEGSARAAEAAAHLEKILRDLLTQSSLLCRIESVRLDGAGGPRAICRVGGELRQLTIHPEVRPEELAALRPWEYVLAHGSGAEAVVVGTYRDSRLREDAHGEIVEFKGYIDRGAGLVRIARDGRGDEVVRLAPDLRATALARPSQLVLFREDPRWAIAALPSDPPQSKFEVPVGTLIHTRLEDIAGLEPILEPLVKDIVLRLIRTDIQALFELRALNGILVHSYQPGTGKTSLARGLARWLHELGEEKGFDVVLYVVKPNELKNKFHGEDARLVREELCGPIRARRAAPRERPLFILVVLDEIDSLGRRAGGDEGGLLSPAQNDAVQALLAEMDGMVQPQSSGSGPPCHVLWVGLTNRVDMVDHALKREGRFDLILEVPALTIEGAENVLAVYARGAGVPWLVGDDIRTAVPEDVVRERFLRPALARTYDVTVLRYAGEGGRRVDVPAGRILAGVHYMNAIHRAKERAADRALQGLGASAVSFEDVLDGLLEQAASTARTLESDRGMLVKILRLKGPVQGVEVVGLDDLMSHEFVRVSS